MSSDQLGPVRFADAGPLTMAYVEYGPPTGPPVLLLHGWPYDPYCYAEVAPRLAAAGHRVIVPWLRGFGPTVFKSAETVRNGQQSALAADIIALMDTVKIDRAVLGGFDWGGRAANIIAALWPERCAAAVLVSGYTLTNLAASRQPLGPAAELGWWYLFYFATERGRTGYREHRRDFARIIWQRASPAWNFSEETYQRSAASFDNPDHVDVVIHNYRWRLGLAAGEPAYDRLEQRLQENPPIAVPSITVGSEFDGTAKNGAAYRARFTGKYEHRVLDGIGHNVPQEAPESFARAVLDAARMG